MSGPGRLRSSVGGCCRCRKMVFPSVEASEGSRIDGGRNSSPNPVLVRVRRPGVNPGPPSPLSIGGNGVSLISNGWSRMPSLSNVLTLMWLSSVTFFLRWPLISISRSVRSASCLIDMPWRWAFFRMVAILRLLPRRAMSVSFCLHFDELDPEIGDDALEVAVAVVGEDRASQREAEWVVIPEEVQVGEDRAECAAARAVSDLDDPDGIFSDPDDVNSFLREPGPRLREFFVGARRDYASDTNGGVEVEPEEILPAPMVVALPDRKVSL